MNCGIGLTNELVISTLSMAVKQQNISADLFLRLDGGSQHASELISAIVKKSSPTQDEPEMSS
jgi:hypothetical protein